MINENVNQSQINLNHFNDKMNKVLDETNELVSEMINSKYHY